MMATRKKKIRFPCPVYEKAAGLETILCSGCGLWTHRGCVPLTAEELTDYAGSDDYFMCPVYAKDSTTGEFYCAKSLGQYDEHVSYESKHC